MSLLQFRRRCGSKAGQINEFPFAVALRACEKNPGGIGFSLCATCKGKDFTIFQLLGKLCLAPLDFFRKLSSRRQCADSAAGPEELSMPTSAVAIAAELLERCPRVALGCVTADVQTHPTSPAPASPALDEQLRACEAHILKLPEPKSVLESSAIDATRKAYKALGKDPARYRGSAEALLRRVIAGKGLPRVNNVVDVINLVSVESRLPIGLYDLAHITGDILFRRGRAGETYKGIGKYDLNLEGLPVFCDAEGPHGSPTSDSERTMVTLATNRVLAIIVSFAGGQALPAWIDRMASLLTEHASAQVLATQVVESA
jgi:DNA/RNA-binding domain of Phe-tRNA-synthetase-like protein